MLCRAKFPVHITTLRLFVITSVLFLHSVRSLHLDFLFVAAIEVHDEQGELLSICVLHDGRYGSAYIAVCLRADISCEHRDAFR